MFTHYPAIHKSILDVICCLPLGVIDGFVTGGEVPSVTNVFRPEKAYFSQLRTITMQKAHTMVQFLLLSVWNLSFTIISRKSGKGAKICIFQYKKCLGSKTSIFESYEKKLWEMHSQMVEFLTVLKIGLQLKHSLRGRPE